MFSSERKWPYYDDDDEYRIIILIQNSVTLNFLLLYWRGNRQGSYFLGESSKKVVSDTYLTRRHTTTFKSNIHIFAVN